MINQLYNRLIGMGIYTLQEAALYGGLSSDKLSRWVFGTRKYPAVIESRVSSQGIVSFYDLVQAMAINKAREFGVPLPKIRQAIDTAKNEYQVEFPLAYSHKLIWFDGELHIEFPNKIVQVSGRWRHQTLIKEIVEPFIKDLHFNTEGLAIRFTPFAKYGRKIILDPQKQFGQPMVEKTGYRADVLDRAFTVERSADLVAVAYNVDVKDVKIAVDYMTSIRRAA